MDGFNKEIKKVNLKKVGSLMTHLNLKMFKHDFDLTCDCQSCSKIRINLGLRPITVQVTVEQEGN